MRLTIRDENIYLLLPVIFILCPTVPKIFHNGLGEQLVFALEVFFMIVLWLYHKYEVRFSYLISAFLIYFLYSLLFSLLCDLLKGVSVLSDYTEIIKPFSFFLFYCFYRYSIIGVEELERKTLRILFATFFFLCIWSIIEILFSDLFLNISYWLYRREELPVLKNKAIGSFAQTYQFGYILLLPFIYVYISFLKRITLKCFLIFVIFLVTILLTQSKSMYVCAFLIIFCSAFLPLFYENGLSAIRTLSLLGILIGALGVIYWIYQDELIVMFEYAIKGFRNILNGTSNSADARTDQLSWALQNNSLILIGGGIGKGEMMLESFYSLYYYRFGIIGISFYLLMIFIVARKAYIVAKYERIIKMRIFYYSLFVFYLLTPIALASSCHQDTPKISFLFYGMIGLICNKYSIQKSK